MRRKILIALLVFLVVITGYLLWQNNDITTTHQEIEVDSEALDGFRIVQLSDLHAKVFGENQKRLVEKVEALEPDLIVLTGDMVDGDVESIETHLAFLKDLTDETPVYAVSGNHEYWSASAEEVRTVYDTLGVTSLEDACTAFSDPSQPITLCGINDFEKFEGFQEYRQTLPEPEENTFNLLLAHRPVHFDTYASFDYDLVLSGHAHGGMIRLPFVGGLYAPDQGFFPSYTTGPYIEDGTTMLVSRGLGNSVFPFRIQNRPELVATTLQSK